MNILITGGLGFIGSNLARRLVVDGNRVTLLDSLVPQYGGNPANIADIRDQVRINISDVRDPYATRELLKLPPQQSPPPITFINTIHHSPTHDISRWRLGHA